jgi:single-stranded DNA-binding protein
MDGEWTETPHYFDFRLFGEKWRGIGERLKKGRMVSIQGHLEQDKWEQGGKKRGSLKIAADRMRLLGKAEQTGQEPDGLLDLSLSGNPETLETGQEDE